MAALAWIGLGTMGYPMAGHLAKRGHAVTVFNRDREKAEKWVSEYGGLAAPTARDAALGKKFVFACVGADDDVREVTIGRTGAFSGMQPGAVFVDHTTASAEVARELYSAAKEQGLNFIDAPVSGGQAGAVNGALTTMAGGDEEPVARAESIAAAYTRAYRRMGGPGAGQLTKMVNQICIAGIVEGLAEGLHFARCAKLDPVQVVEVISKGAAQSWQMDNRHKTMAEGKFDFGFAVDWMRKDLGICLDEARRNGARLPVSALVDQFYAELQALGGGRWDTSSLFARLEVRIANSTAARRQT